MTKTLINLVFCMCFFTNEEKTRKKSLIRLDETRRGAWPGNVTLVIVCWESPDIKYEMHIAISVNGNFPIWFYSSSGFLVTTIW